MDSMMINNIPKKAILLAPFFSEHALSSRPLLVSKVLSRFQDVDIVTTDFDHQTKSFKAPWVPEGNRKIYFIKTLGYASNVGVMRFLSHALFSLKAAVFFVKRRNNYDLVYVTLPLNLAALLVFPFSRHQIKIADVVDIWPDVLPFSKSFRKCFFPLFWLWKRAFRFSIAKSDVLMTVSDTFFDESVKYFKKDLNLAKRFYIGHPELSRAYVAREDELTIVYIGNIGHLYDFSTLLGALSLPELRGKYQLFIIGDGNRRTWLLQQLQVLSIKFKYFGIEYDENALTGILSRCDVGFNGYFNTTAAFSYKANTYIAAGLPIINSMQGDLQSIIEKWGIGYNYIAGDVLSLSNCLSSVSRDGLHLMAEKSNEFFKKELDQNVIMNKMELFINSIKSGQKNE
jgi:glycosyltransferase involved in cell wall biosynthesis